MQARRDAMRMMLAMPLLMAAGGAPAPGLAAAGTPDLALSCETALAPGLAAVALAYRAATGVRVHVHATAAHLLLPQLARDIQNEIVVAGGGVMAQAQAAGLVPDPAPALWRDAVVLVGRRGADAPGPVWGPVAVPDDWPGGLDGRALLASFGLPAAAIGGADTQEVAFLVLSGRAGRGIVTRTDARANPRLLPLAERAEPTLPVRAGISSLARRGDPARFMAYLLGPQSQAILAQAGLERAA